ncbi:hypothetical protein U6W19_12325, partial [Cutibacterium acnes]
SVHRKETQTGNLFRLLILKKVTPFIIQIILLLSSVQSFSHVQLFATPWTTHSPPGSSVHGILQARILEWVAISFSRGSSQPRD